MPDDDRDDQLQPPPEPRDPAFAEWVDRYLDDQLSPEELAEFAGSMRGDPGRQELFVTLCLQAQMLSELVPPALTASGAGGESLLDDDDARPGSPARSLVNLHETMVLPGIRPDEAADPDAPTFADPPPTWPKPAAATPWYRRRAVRYAAAAAVAISALAGANAYLNQPTTTRVVVVPPPSTSVPAPSFPDVPPAPALAPATLVAAAGAEWEGVYRGLRPGDRLPATVLSLTAGLAEIRFDSGATVIVEAPASFQPADNAADLRFGRLSATVPAPAVGFAVRTPSGRVVDLGTEFGVDARRGGETSVAVFKGKVTAAPQSAADGGGAAAAAPSVLTEGQAANVSAGAVVRDPRGAVPQQFVRRIVSDAATLDVVDLVAGGDGTGGRRGAAVDLMSGKAGGLAPVQHQQTDNRYHRVPTLPVVDGCFVPDGRGGPVQVTSAGQAFAFPATTGRAYNHVWAGGGLDQMTGKPLAHLMGETDYAAPGRGALAVHSNMGLTLDLDAVRRLHPGKRLVRFRCLFGNARPKPQDDGRVDAFVLVDGRPRLERRGLLHRDAPLAVDVPLEPGDRFLTLAVTDGGDELAYDGMLWADPVIDLAPR